MKSYQAKCPNLVRATSNEAKLIVCGCAGYEVLVKGVFTQASGYDPLAMKVKCRRCRQEYYLFLQVNYKEVRLTQRSPEPDDVCQ